MPGKYTTTGGKWLTINADGTYSGIPADTNAGRNTFLLMLRKPGETDTVIELTINVIGANGEVFMESFGGYKGTRDGQQLKTKLNLAYSGKVSGWTQSGMHAMHAVDRSFGGGEVTPSDWAIMIFEDDVITSAEIDANARRETYRVAFQASPAVYVQESQATKRGDTLLIEVLRKDGSVLKQFTHAPGAWKGKMDFAPQHFEYKGDGSGTLRLRIGPAGGKTSGRFMGAVDNVVVRKR